jgi:hypothetical protein
MFQYGGRKFNISFEIDNTASYLLLTYISIDAGMLSRGSLSKFLYKNRYIYQDIFRFAWKFFLSLTMIATYTWLQPSLETTPLENPSLFSRSVCDIAA